MNKIIFILVIGAGICVASCSEQPVSQASYNEGINIIPAPQSLVEGEGVFSVNGQTAFYASAPESKTVAEFFAARLKTSTGYRLATVDKENGSNNMIALYIDALPGVNDEGYTLDVTPGKVVVKAKTPQGLFYGMQTFLQLLPAEVESPKVVKNVAWTSPAVSVKDEPRFGYRGLMLDAVRHFIPLEDVKKQIDVIALFKLNRLHLHLTDDQGWRIEIKKYPRLTEIGSKGKNSSGFYTQEDIKEIVRYAAERFITAVPEIEMPGHGLGAISACPELSCKDEIVSPRPLWGIEETVFCAGKESTFEFLENVIAEVSALFPSEYIHIGGDECPKDSWRACPYCQARIRELGLKTAARHTAEQRLQSYFVQRMEKVLAKYGKKMIGWDEILEGGLAPAATVMSWRGEKGGIAAASMGHDVIMTPGSQGMYIDAYQGDSRVEPLAIGGYALLEKTYAYNPVPDTLTKTAKGHFVKGVQCNAWSEFMYTPALMEYRIYPRILALSEIAWTQLENKDFEDFCRRVDNAYVRLDGHDVNYHIPLPEQPFGSCDFVAFTDTASLTFKTTRPVKVVYTLDGSEPAPQSTVYENSVRFTESGILKIRSVLPSGKMSKTREITVEKQAFSTPVKPEAAFHGLKVQITDGEYADVSQLAGAKTWRDSTLEKVSDLIRIRPYSMSMRNYPQYAAIATGYMNIPEDNIYFFSSELEEVWIDGKKLIDNRGEVKRFSRHDTSAALGKGLHLLKAVFLGHIIGGWPSNWGSGNVLTVRKADEESFSPVRVY
jgi:hexosaminidase